MKPYIIDYEFVAPTYAINDISKIFQGRLFGTTDIQGKRRFCKIYLEELGLPNTEEQIDLLIFDAEVNKTRVFKCLLGCEMEKKEKNPKYDFQIYKIYEKFEEEARTDKTLFKRI